MSGFLRAFVPAVDPKHLSNGGGNARSSPPPAVAPPIGGGANLNGTGGGSSVAVSSDPVELKTMLVRVETSSLLSERRAAVTTAAKMVSANPELCSKITEPQVAALLAVVEQYKGENDIVAAACELLFSVLRLWTSTPSSSSGRPTNNSNPSTSAASSKMVQRILEHVPLFAGRLSKDEADFWVRYNVVQLMIELQRADGAGFSAKLARAENGVSDVVGVLSDDSPQADMIRGEGLVLVLELTAGAHANAEVLSMLAFFGLFDVLFELVKDEGGILSGSVSVRDCLTVVQNMVRSDRQASMYFREMGHVRHLADFLTAAGSAGAAAMDRGTLEALGGVVQCISAHLNGADRNGAGVETRTSLLHTGVLIALAKHTFELLPQTRMDDSGSAECVALRTLTLAVQNSSDGAKALASLQINASGAVASLLWHALLASLANANNELQSAAAGLVATMIDAGGTETAQVVVQGLGPRSASPSGAQLCGGLLGAYLFAAQQPTDATRYIAAHMLAMCVKSSPGLTEQIIATPWDGQSTFFASYVAHTISDFGSRQRSHPEVSAALRPILFALARTPKALFVFLSEPEWIQFFVGRAGWGREGPHVAYLFATVVMLAYVGVADISPKGGLPKTCRVDAAALDAIVASQLTVAAYRNMGQSTAADSDRRQAPRGHALAELPRSYIYDGDLIELLNYVHAKVDAAAKQTTPAGQTTASTPSGSPTTTVALPSDSTAPSANPVHPGSGASNHAALNEELEALRSEMRSLQDKAEKDVAAARQVASDADAARLAAVQEIVEAKRRHEAEQLQAATAASEAAAAKEERIRSLEEQLAIKTADADEFAKTIDLLEGELRNAQSGASEVRELRVRVQDVEEENGELLLLVAELHETLLGAGVALDDADDAATPRTDGTSRPVVVAADDDAAAAGDTGRISGIVDVSPATTVTPRPSMRGDVGEEEIR